MERIIHPIEPVYNRDSKILVLGSFPSVKSREQGFFYGHPQNRFWRMIATILGVDIPETVEEKRVLLLEHNIALWDVIASCDIEGSSDSSIRNVVANDISRIIDFANIQCIICNGAKSYELYQKHLEPAISYKAVKLPSTSPANAAFTIDKLIDIWGKEILKYR